MLRGHIDCGDCTVEERYTENRTDRPGPKKKKQARTLSSATEETNGVAILLKHALVPGMTGVVLIGCTRTASDGMSPQRRIFGKRCWRCSACGRLRGCREAT